jgi:hypothetical protein
MSPPDKKNGHGQLDGRERCAGCLRAAFPSNGEESQATGISRVAYPWSVAAPPAAAGIAG